MNEELRKKFDEMKAKHQDALLLFNVGDFYETYEEDAETVAEVLGLTLTRKGDTKMAGFPRHSLDTYLPKLVRAGKRVAICEQMLETKVAKMPAKSSAPASTYGEVQKIPVADIHPSPMNPRKTFYEEAICELADSIKQHGLLQPITVRETYDENDKLFFTGYEIVMGERRFRAWKENMAVVPNFPTSIPCIVRNMTDEEALDAMITENLQRKDVDPIEEAFAFGQLHANGKSIEEIAVRFGKSARFIQERIKLDKLLPELKQWVTKGWMNIGAAMHICKLTPDEQEQFCNEYVAEGIGDDTDPITKSDAMSFTDDLFMRIDRADWKPDFEGSCKTTCEKCPFNNANVGCLFYEMKPHDATCTNRARWDAKRASWLYQMIDDNADVLVKKGEDLEAGKTIILKETNTYYAERCTEFEPLLEKVDAMGFRVAKVTDFFDKWSHYHEEDSRLKEKLENNEVYRCLCIEQNYRGTEIKIRYYQWKKVTEENSAESNAMRLVSAYKDNMSKANAAFAKKMRETLKRYDTDSVTQGFSDNEWKIMLTLLINTSAYTVRETIMGDERDEISFSEKNNTPDKRVKIFRDWMKGKVSDTSVEWYEVLQKCQSWLIDEWGIDASEIRQQVAEDFAKKQAKIVEQLTELGYTVDGKKIEQ